MLSKQAKANFETMLRAAQDGRLALVECTRASDGKTVPVICAASDQEIDGEPGFDFVPIAEFTAGYANPYEVFVPPSDRQDAIGDIALTMEETKR